MMKVTSVICIKKMGSDCTPLLPRKIATPAMIRPSKYRRKDVEDIERRGSHHLILYRQDARRNIPISYRVIVTIIIAVVVVVVSVDKPQ